MKTCVLFVVCLFLSRESAAAEIDVAPSNRNVIAARLDGVWRLDPELTTGLGAKVPQNGGLITFRSDPAAADAVPDDLAEQLQHREMRVYLAGYMEHRQKKQWFLLTVFEGNPVILSATGDAAVIIAVARDKTGDLLFIGEGYEDKEPFQVYRRMESEQTDEAR